MCTSPRTPHRRKHTNCGDPRHPAVKRPTHELDGTDPTLSAAYVPTHGIHTTQSTEHAPNAMIRKWATHLKPTNSPDRSQLRMPRIIIPRCPFNAVPQPTQLYLQRHALRTSTAANHTKNAPIPRHVKTAKRRPQSHPTPFPRCEHHRPSNTQSQPANTAG